MTSLLLFVLPAIFFKALPQLAGLFRSLAALCATTPPAYAANYSNLAILRAHLQNKLESMPQRVIIEPFHTAVTGFTPNGYEFASTTAIGKALLDGWRIVHVTSAPVPELSTVYVTFVVEKSADTGYSGS